MLLKLKTKTAWIFYHAWLIKLNIRTTYFYLKKISRSTCSDESRVRSLFTIRPAVEKTRSAGTEVAGTARYHWQGCLALQIETHLLSTTIKDPGLQRCMAPWSSFRFRCHAEKHHSCRSPSPKRVSSAVAESGLLCMGLTGFGIVSQSCFRFSFTLSRSSVSRNLRCLCLGSKAAAIRGRYTFSASSATATMRRFRDSATAFLNSDTLGDSLLCVFRCLVMRLCVIG